MLINHVLTRQSPNTTTLWSVLASGGKVHKNDHTAPCFRSRFICCLARKSCICFLFIEGALAEGIQERLRDFPSCAQITATGSRIIIVSTERGWKQLGLREELGKIRVWKISPSRSYLVCAGNVREPFPRTRRRDVTTVPSLRRARCLTLPCRCQSCIPVVSPLASPSRQLGAEARPCVFLSGSLHLWGRRRYRRCCYY